MIERNQMVDIRAEAALIKPHCAVFRMQARLTVAVTSMKVRTDAERLYPGAPHRVRNSSTPAPTGH